ncbi:MAG TPA: endonuclease III [Nitrososphaera sp.]|nr:endonuclease III [Nitrososphaera sp.]
MAASRRKPMKVIIQAMQDTLRRQKPPRLTALKGLQMEETGDPFKILIGTILSARTRDENTTKVVRKFFERYTTPEEVACADIDEIKKIIHSIGFYNVKANRIKEVAKVLVERHGGRVPSNIDDLLQLPGVGRKTANCVLVYAFDKPAIPVDIHVHRISNRLGLVKTKTPEQTETELMKIVDRSLWTSVNDTFVMYGQNICVPIKPHCSMCNLKNSCSYSISNRKVFAS